MNPSLKSRLKKKGELKTAIIVHCAEYLSFDLAQELAMKIVQKVERYERD